jgi:hypothetical protein
MPWGFQWIFSVQNLNIATSPKRDPLDVAYLKTGEKNGSQGALFCCRSCSKPYGGVLKKKANRDAAISLKQEESR